MDGLQDKLDDTYLDGSPKHFYGKYARKYDDSRMYSKTPEGAIRGQGNLLKLLEDLKKEGTMETLNPPPSPFISKIGSEVKSFNTPTPYNSENTYADQFRIQGDEILLKRTIDEYR